MFSEMKKEVNAFLLNYFENKGSFNKVIYDSASYSLNIGGKRIRPLLMLLTYNMYKENWREILEFSSAIEMIHTYSLIHDDLPCMDNDDYRRNELTCHKKFNEYDALLAGDSLLSLAFETIVSKTTHITDEEKCRIVLVLSKAVGYKGMCLGQSLDMRFEKENKAKTHIIQDAPSKTHDM